MAEELLKRQVKILREIERIHTNFSKDSASRKTATYLKERLDALEKHWQEFDANNTILQACEDRSAEYFSYAGGIKTNQVSSASTSGDRGIDQQISQQGTNFRAFERHLNRIRASRLEEKWEIEDELKTLQHLWHSIDSLHLHIDNILQGSDEDYERDFSNMESQYIEMKQKLNRKLCSTEQLRHSTPQIDIPVFLGKYTQWPTFYDLFMETIHNSKYLTKTQKMQHLKTKFKGEAERLIQHLNITAENYETAWSLLTGRYNNPQILFTNHTFLNQSVIQKQTSHELKKLYDTTMECIHAIHNLGIDTSTWDPILVHLISKKLDADTYTDYKESLASPRVLPVFDELMAFIEKKFMALEPIQRKTKEPTPSVKQPTQQPPKYNYSNFSQKRSGPRNYQAVATSSCITKCLVCDLDHELFQCKRFLNQPSDAIMNTIAKLQVCRNCLYKHEDTLCPSTKKCKICNGNHNTIIHDAAVNVPTNPKNSTPIQPRATNANPSSSKSSPRKHNVNYVASEDEEILLTTLSLNIKASDGTFINFRALLDQGAQVSLISENAAQMLGLKRQRYQASISGVGTSSKQSKGLVSIECHSIYGDYEFTTEALVVSRVINNLPSTTLQKQSWEHLQHTRLADPEYHVSKPIDILLDASVYSEIIMSGLVKGTHQSPIAQQTKLGWILSGHVRTFKCNVVIKTLDDLKKYWEVEDINESPASLTADEQYCEDHFQATTKRLEDGRYEVAIPMKPGFEEQLGRSKSKATAQFIQQERRMAKNSSLSEGYKKFMHEYRQLGHMRPADSQGGQNACYLPHHGVLKLDSTTTALRVVFNASSKTSSGLSLNDLMEGGPNLQQDLHSLILKWRQFRYVVTADIEKMFRQILVREADQHLQTIIWRYSPSDLLREYHLTTVTYGTKSAPFLAMRTLKQIGRDNADTFKLAASALENSFYMDDLLAGSNSLIQAKNLQRELTAVLKGAGMNIRKWSSNESELIKDLPAELLNAPFEFRDSESRKTLGLQWNSSSDTFAYAQKIDCDANIEQCTKRQLLSDIAKIYDPMGWITPLAIKAKILFQKTWASPISWDDVLPENILREWSQVRDDLKNIPKFSIPRYLGDMHHSFQIHGFCDASEKAYACAIYIVTLNHKGEYTSTLIAAKSKVAPHNKVVTLPRLELLGALLLSQLMAKFLETISTNNFKVYAWTDSMVVLGWLHGNSSRWKQFVANRVNQIKKIIPQSAWNHVKSSDNAADCATRGMSAASLVEHTLWWAGPEWLLTGNTTVMEQKSYPSPTLEVKKASVNTALLQKPETFTQELLNKSSSITRVIRITAWVLRFIARLRNTQATAHGSTLTSAEMDSARNLIIKNAQDCELDSEITQLKKTGHVTSSCRLAALRPFLDKQGILRVGGRLENAVITYSAKHPVILASKSRLTELIIHQAHLNTLHGGPRLTLSFIREKYWILSGIRAVKRQVRLCTKCRRFSQESNQQLMADLPGPRVTPSRPFTHIGVDFTGHMDIKANKGRGIKTKKGYVAVFICLVTKAVHLELVSDLSTPAFLAALRRMCARRGTPSNVYSDNGTNFVGAARLLKTEYKEIIHSINTNQAIVDMTNMGISWRFNAPAWPNAGGLWEAAVKSLKHHLKRIIGEQKLTYEEFITLLHQIEACLNSRPLCSLTKSPDDFCLTPGKV